MKILIIQTAFLGDVVLTTSLLTHLRNAHADATIDVVVRADLVSILEGHPDISEVIGFDKRGADRGLGGLLSFARRLRARSYDRCYLPHRSLRSALLAWRAGIGERIGYAGAPGGFLYTQTVARPETGHYTDKLAALVAERDAPLPTLPVADDARKAIDARLDAEGIGAAEPVALLAPGSVWATKRWTARGYAGVARELSQRYRVVLVGSEADRPAADAVIEHFETTDWVGRTNLRELVALCARANLYIGNDSGPTHVAAAVGTPVVAVFGPTVPAFGFAPRSAGSAEVVEIELECRPCHAHGPMKCPLGHHDCMNRIDAASVLDAAQRVAGS